jgi:predicted phosphoribosyltransferase
LRLIVALPGGPARTLDEIRAFEGVDEVIALSVPESFFAVGQLYDSFAQVSTDEVCDALRRSRERRSALAAAAAE